MRSQGVAQASTCYEALQLQPSAPLELITAAYWKLVGETQTRRATDPAAEGEIHYLTLAYLILTNPEFRTEYDSSIGVEQYVPTRLAPDAKQGWFHRSKREEPNWTELDHYGVLRVAHFAEPGVIAEAYSVLLPYCGRLINNGYADWELLDRLDEAYATVSDPEKRREYDEGLKGIARPRPVESNGAAPSRKNAVPSNGSVSVPPSTPKLEATDSNGASHSQLTTVSAMATGAIEAMGRQLTRMSKREQRRTQEKHAQRPQLGDDIQPNGPDPESVLLKRISSTVGTGGGNALVGEKPIARVTVAAGPGGRAIFDLEVFPATIGGAQGCDITLPGLAEHHATLLHREGRFVVFNLTGREVGDPEDVDAVRLLENGDELKLGPYKLLFSAVAAEAPESSNSN